MTRSTPRVGATLAALAAAGPARRLREQRQVELRHDRGAVRRPRRPPASGATTDAEGRGAGPRGASSRRARSRSPPTRATRRTSSSARRQDRRGHGRRPGQGAHRRHGSEGQGGERDVRRDHPGPGVEEVRPRHVVVHRHQGAREDGRLRDLPRRRARRSTSRRRAARRSTALADLCGHKVAVEKGTTQADGRHRAGQEVHGGAASPA